jgi:hypothetical protein
MFRTANNTRLAVAFIIVLLMIGAAAGRAMHVSHNHSAHVRALAVDSMCLVCALAPLAASAFVLPIPPSRKLASPERLTLAHCESGALSEPVTRPPPTFA